MIFWLGIDGGGTGCRAAVVDAAGNVLGSGTSGPANISSDLEGARANILSAARSAVAQAVGSGEVDAVLPELRVGMGLAGANAAGVVGRLMEGLPFRHFRIETDAISAVKGALLNQDGIVAAIGTGSVFARQTAGVIRQIGGWGLILGDNGGGAWIGREMLVSCLRAAEGFDPMTDLARAVLEEFGGQDAIIRFSLTARPVDYAALAPRMIASADPLAERIMERASADVASAIELLQKEGPVPVTFIGGLGPTFRERLAGRWDIRAPLGNALDGAVFLARGLT
jgi:glucosamine kinase